MDVLYTKEEDRIQFNNVATPLSEQCEFRNSREGIGKTLSRICSSLCSHIFVLSTGEVAKNFTSSTVCAGRVPANFSSPQGEDRMLNERKRIESILGEGLARRELSRLAHSFLLPRWEKVGKARMRVDIKAY